MGLIHEHRDERKPGHAESEDSGYKKQKWSGQKNRAIGEQVNWEYNGVSLNKSKLYKSIEIA